MSNLWDETEDEDEGADNDKDGLGSGDDNVGSGDEGNDTEGTDENA